MQIQWYPGHMAKARRLLLEDLKLVDVVAELVDARAPAATQNPDFDELFTGKSRVILLNKSDLADPALTKRWIAQFRARGFAAGGISATAPRCRAEVIALIEAAAAEAVERMRKKGVNKVVRALIAGIPNVGKSTLINRVAGGKRAAVGDKPGVTRAKQWVKITPYLELMDTPGLLWPKLADQDLARHLAYIGSIRDELVPAEELASALLGELMSLSRDALLARYPKLTSDADSGDLLALVCRSRGFLLSGGEPDTERAARIVLDEFRAGKLGRVTLEAPQGEGGRI